MENAVKVAANFQKTKTAMESQISSLKSKLSAKEDVNYKEDQDRLKFNEGSLWISKKYLT